MKIRQYLIKGLNIIREFNSVMAICMIIVYFMIRILIVGTIISVMQMNNLELNVLINIIMQIYVFYPMYYYMFEKIYLALNKYDFMKEDNPN